MVCKVYAVIFVSNGYVHLCARKERQGP